MAATSSNVASDIVSKPAVNQSIATPVILPLSSSATTTAATTTSSSAPASVNDGGSGYLRASCTRCQSVLRYPSYVTSVRCPVCTTVTLSSLLYASPSVAPAVVDQSLRTQCEQWSITQVCVFMKNLGMGHLVDHFSRAFVDGKRFVSLNEHDLREELYLESDQDVDQVLGAIGILRNGNNDNAPVPAPTMTTAPPIGMPPSLAQQPVAPAVAHGHHHGHQGHYVQQPMVAMAPMHHQHMQQQQPMVHAPPPPPAPQPRAKRAKRAPAAATVPVAPQQYSPYGHNWQQQAAPPMMYPAMNMDQHMMHQQHMQQQQQQYYMQGYPMTMMSGPGPIAALPVPSSAGYGMQHHGGQPMMMQQQHGGQHMQPMMTPMAGMHHNNGMTAPHHGHGGHGMMMAPTSNTGGAVAATIVNGGPHDAAKHT